jgi:cytochrome P450
MTVASTHVDQPVADLYAWLEEMRTSRPSGYDEQTRAWHLFGYTDAQQALADPTLTSDLRAVFQAAGQQATVPPVIERLNRSSFFLSDKSAHHRQRALVNKVFTRKMVTALAPRIGELATGLLTGLRNRTEFDLIEEFTHPSPVHFLCEVIGIPVADRDSFGRWATALADPSRVGPADGDPGAALEGLLGELEAYLLDLSRRSRANPGDDLASRLVTAEVDGAVLGDEDVASLIAMIVLAGHNTTTMLLSNFVLCLDENPSAAAEIRDDRTLVASAIDEVLRYRTLLPRLLRLTTADTRIGDHTVPAGTPVAIWVAAANRDPGQFADPGVFDIRRTPNRHLTFGHGMHLCLGMHLAKAAGEIAISALLDACADITVVRDEPLRYSRPRINLSPDRLPVRVRWA